MKVAINLCLSLLLVATIQFLIEGALFFKRDRADHRQQIQLIQQHGITCLTYGAGALQCWPDELPTTTGRPQTHEPRGPERIPAPQTGRAPTTIAERFVL